jgi:hypothetical protein
MKTPEQITYINRAMIVEKNILFALTRENQQMHLRFFGKLEEELIVLFKVNLSVQRYSS